LNYPRTNIMPFWKKYLTYLRYMLYYN
jgi:hypothetical protein